jgi:hypothetical protein
MQINAGLAQPLPRSPLWSMGTPFEWGTQKLPTLSRVPLLDGMLRSLMGTFHLSIVLEVVWRVGEKYPLDELSMPMSFSDAPAVHADAFCFVAVAF